MEEYKINNKNLVIKNKDGKTIVIPEKYRVEVEDMIKYKCNACLDKLVDILEKTKQDNV